MTVATAKAIAQHMSNAIDVKYPHNWVVLVMDMVTGMVEPITFEKTDEGKRKATDVLLVASIVLPLDVLVFTNIPNPSA